MLAFVEPFLEDGDDSPADADGVDFYLDGLRYAALNVGCFGFPNVVEAYVGDVDRVLVRFAAGAVDDAGPVAVGFADNEFVSAVGSDVYA